MRKLKELVVRSYLASARTIKLVVIVCVVVAICPLLLSLALLLVILFLIAFAACGIGFIIFKLFE